MSREYFEYLRNISWGGIVYKRLFSSPILFSLARCFGSRILDVGCGTGSGILGTFPQFVHGVDTNSFAVEHCRKFGWQADHIVREGILPFRSNEFDVCVLDNVLEHVKSPADLLDECCRVTRFKGGLVVVVPGKKGFESDDDHKVFFSEENLRCLDEMWKLKMLFSIPFIFKSHVLSEVVREYCLVAVYKKRHSVLCKKECPELQQKCAGSSLKGQIE